MVVFGWEKTDSCLCSESDPSLKGPESSFLAPKHVSTACLLRISCESVQELELSEPLGTGAFASKFSPRQANSVGSHIIMRMPVY